VEAEVSVAFVTGAASGIGAATARRLTKDGLTVVVADLNLDAARAVAAEVDGFAVHCDVADTDLVGAAIGGAEQAVGPNDVLVNNAGADRMAMFVETNASDWDTVLAVNLRGAIACTHAVLPGMLERRRGAIVNVASEAGRVGAVAGAVYSAAKAGVIGFTKAIARESARKGVRCNAVAPGPIETPLLNGAAAAYGAAGDRMKQMMIDATAMGRSGSPDEVAAAIAFLASDDASFITGDTIAVSGGISMW
jgi:2-hydroxycyclohexanecarboxyl-CoA dehydrogenase